MFNAMDYTFIPPAAERETVFERPHGRFDLSNYEAVMEIPVFCGSPPNVHDRAVQALRDVRHMLPQHGVAIVDAVLDGIG